MKIMYPNTFYLLRGNHEFDSVCSQYGFKEEILNYHTPKKQKKKSLLKEFPKAQNVIDLNLKEDENKKHENENTSKYEERNDINCYKYTEKLYDAFILAFDCLPIAAILNNTTFCIHGGLTPRLEYINDINVSIKRPIHDFEHNLLLADVIWSDPDRSIRSLFIENPRGRGFLFNHDAVAQFLFRNSVKKLIRVHQCVKKGSHTQFDEMCVTVFSASSYEKYKSNHSGIVKLFEENDKIKIVTFPPLHRIEKKDVVYYKIQALYQKDETVHHCFSFLHPKLCSNVASRMVMKQCRKLKILRSDIK